MLFANSIRKANVLAARSPSSSTPSSTPQPPGNSTGQQHTVVSPPASRGSPMKSASKVITTSKNLYSKCASKLSSKASQVFGRKSQTSSKSPSVLSTTSRASSTSTAATTHTLPIPDCGDPFKVPGFETSKFESPPNHESPSIGRILGTPTSKVTEPDSVSTGLMASDSSVETEEVVQVEQEQLCLDTGTACRLLQHLKEIPTVIHVFSEGAVPEHIAGDNDHTAHSETAKELDNEESVQAEIALMESNTDNNGDGDDKDEDDNNDDGDGGDEEDQEDDEEADEEDDPPRCDFKTIGAIPDAAYKNLARMYFLSTDEGQHVHISGRTRGSYNAVTFIEIEVGEKVHQLIVRVPAHATPSQWKGQDDYTMECEVRLVEYIRKNTTAPVPGIISYSTGHDNVLGFPYILMTKLPGKPATNIWFDQDYNPADVRLAYRNADVPSVDTEKKRITFLRSLAQVMTEIQQLTFDRIGLPLFTEEGEHYGVGPSYHWDADEHKFIERKACSTTQDYLQAALNAFFKPQAMLGHGEKSTSHIFGTRFFLRAIFAQPVFNHHPAPETETFTIKHNDLDLQNILVDDQGNVTGIIDWDHARAAPRCIGAAAVPLFLRNDWFPRYANNLLNAPHMAWNYHYYRQVYAAAMLEAGNVEDAKYTVKSALYQAAVAAITDDGNERDLIEKLLHEIPNCRIDVDEFKIALGRGWPDATAMLQKELAVIFEPELPPARFLEQVDAGLELGDWWKSFDDLLLLEE